MRDEFCRNVGCFIVSYTATTAINQIMLNSAMMLDSAYGYMNMQGLLTLLPEGFSPSDLPYLGEFLQNIDPWNHTAHITKETVTLKIVTHAQNSSDSTLQEIQFYTYKG